MKKTLLFSGLLIILLSVFLFATVFVVVGLCNNNVAYASESNGIVENNLIPENDLQITATTTATSGFRIATANTTFSEGTLTNSRGLNSACYVVYWLDSTTFELNKTYTLTFYIRTGTNADIGFRCGFSKYNNNTLTSMIVSPYQYSNGVCSITFTPSSSIYSSSDNLVLWFGSNTSSTIILSWVKLEKSDSFTGYVKKDYSYYGYDDGYTDGISVNMSSSLSGNVLDSAYSVYDNNRKTGETGTSFNALGLNYWQNFIGSDDLFCTYASQNGWPFSTNGISPYSYLYLNLGVASSNNILVFYKSDITGFIYIEDLNTYINLSNFTPVATDYEYSINGVSQPIYLFEVPLNTGGLSFTASNIYFLDSISSEVLPPFYTTISKSVYYYLAGTSSESYNNGYDSGYDSGYYTGYNEGLNANRFTFLNLFSAVIDAPVQAFSGLFDFNLLGWNMKNFLLAMLTLSIGLFIWKIIARGG